MTSRAARGIPWLASVWNESLPTGERLAVTTAETWLAVTTLDHERLAPGGSSRDVRVCASSNGRLLQWELTIG